MPDDAMSPHEQSGRTHTEWETQLVPERKPPWLQPEPDGGLFCDSVLPAGSGQATKGISVQV